MFDSGDSSQVVTVDIIDDQISESDESFEVFLKPIPDTSNVIIGEPSVAVGTILDDDCELL